MDSADNHFAGPAGAPRQYTAFSGTHCIAHGDLHEVAQRAKRTLDAVEQPQLVIFDDATGHVIDIDLRGSADDVSQRVARAAARPATDVEKPQSTAPRRPGRPRLGVVAREVTLLPRHWEWLARQPGGASVALRKLVEAARRDPQGKDRLREAREAAYRFMSALAGNEAGFEEASRALFSGRRADFESHIEGWPKDVRAHAARLAAPSFEIDTGPTGEPAR